MTLLTAALLCLIAFGLVVCATTAVCVLVLVLSVSLPALATKWSRLHHRYHLVRRRAARRSNPCHDLMAAMRRSTWRLVLLREDRRLNEAPRALAIARDRDRRFFERWPK